jgi:putative membrane protein
LNVLYRSWGWWGMLRVTAVVLILVWAVQAIIIRSGMPYGNLQYTSSLQPQLLGIPFIIPPTWLMMLPPSWVVARLITRKLSGCLLRPLFVLMSAVAFTGWMVSFDPLLTRLGILLWTPAGDYYGTPAWNYVFWLFIAALLTFAISPNRVPGAPLLLVYTLSWLVTFISLLLFGGLLVPALVGFVVMGGVLVGAGLNSRT